MNNQNWDIDEHYAKHCVRYYGWLPASVSYKGKNDVKAIKYFTLCGVKALDVFTLEMAGVLTRDKTNNKLPNITICERDPALIPDILRVVSPPSSEAVIAAKIEDVMFYDAVLQKAEQEVISHRAKAITSHKLRKAKYLSAFYERIKGAGPFHIINFDTCGSMINNKKLFSSFFKMVELQKGNIKSFLAFLTTECHSVETSVEETFRRCVEHNASRHTEIRKALVSKYESSGYDAIKDGSIRLSFGFVKCAVIPAAARLGWAVRLLGIYVYENPNLNKMLNLVAEFTDGDSKIQDSDCIDKIVALIREDPAFFSLEEAERDEVMLKHLSDVIEYRENIPREYE